MYIFVLFILGLHILNSQTNARITDNIEEMMLPKFWVDNPLGKMNRSYENIMYRNERIKNNIDEVMSEYETEPIYFIGNYADSLINFEYDYSVHRMIDTSTKKYYLDLNILIPYYRLQTKKTLNKLSSIYKFNVLVTNSDNKVVLDKSEVKQLNFSTKNYTDIMFQNKRHNFKLKNLKNDTYTFKIFIKDSLSGFYNVSSFQKQYTSGETDEFLVSDIRFFDTDVKHPILNSRNNFGNREGNVLGFFQTYARKKSGLYTVDLEAVEKTYTIKELFKFIDTKIISSIGDLFRTKQGTFEKKIERMKKESLFYHRYEITQNESVELQTFTIDKRAFKNLHFSNELEYPTRINYEFSISKQIEKEIAIKGDLGITNVDSIKKRDINFDEYTLGTTESVISVEELFNHTNVSSFFWEFVPQTLDEFELAIKKINFYTDKDSVYYKKTSPLVSLNYNFIQYWENQAKKKNFNHWKLAMINYYEKIEFCVKNFVNLQIIEGSLLPNLTLRDGWKTDKTYFFMKYGFPDKIHGQSIFNSLGEVQPRNFIPKQTWMYNDITEPIEFIGSNLRSRSTDDYFNSDLKDLYESKYREIKEP